NRIDANEAVPTTERIQQLIRLRDRTIQQRVAHLRRPIAVERIEHNLVRQADRDDVVGPGGQHKDREGDDDNEYCFHLSESPASICETSYESSACTKRLTSPPVTAPFPSRSAQGHAPPRMRQLTKFCTSRPSRWPSRFMSPGNAHVSAVPGQKPPVNCNEP